MQKWEYLTFREYNYGRMAQINEKQEAGLMETLGFGKGTKPYEMLNKLGQDGWELVGLGQDNMNGLNYVFKRPVT